MRDNITAMITAQRYANPIASSALEALLTLIECIVDERLHRFEETARQVRDQKADRNTEVEEYLDIDLLSQRINTPVKTIRDWVHKKKIPFEKLPTGGIRFSWRKVEAWIQGERSC